MFLKEEATLPYSMILLTLKMVINLIAKFIKTIGYIKLNKIMCYIRAIGFEGKSGSPSTHEEQELLFL